jgi:superfamily II DNA/RNA helicase
MNTQSFADLGVSSAVCGALDVEGITEPFAIQSLVVADVLAGRDVLAKSPTGSGKTLAFMVPLIDRIEATDRRPAALILAPTRELATQIVDATYRIAHARALKVKAVYGGVGLEKQAREAAKSHIIVATPGRLEDLLERRAFSLEHVRVLVLDEADRMLDMGFKPAVDRIVAQCPRGRQTLFFSATLDGEAGRIAARYTDDPVRHEHVPVVERATDIEHRFMPVERDARIRALIRELAAERERTLVFVRTKRGADRLVKRLAAEGKAAVAMHGDKSQRQREKALASFEAGRVDTLVATDVAARGIDVDGISHVINFDPPEDREGYVHRIGRTGRAGRSGVGITFVSREQAADVSRIAAELELQREFAASGHATGHRRNGAGGSGRGSGERSPRGGGSRRTVRHGNGSQSGKRVWSASPRGGRGRR